MTETVPPYDHDQNGNLPNEAFMALNQCIEHVITQVADGHATVAALIAYKDVRGNVTFMATGPGRVVDAGFDGYRFTFTEEPPEGCEPVLPS